MISTGTVLAWDRAAVIRAWLIGVFGVLGCEGSPQPDPPNFDVSQVRIVPKTSSSYPLFGLAGTISPPEGDVWLWDLDEASAPTVAPVQGDGSFGPIQIRPATTELRIQLRSGEMRSSPLDVVVVGDRLGLASRALSDCLSIPLEVAIGGTHADIVVDNRCADMITIDALTLRQGVAALRVSGPAAPFSVAANSSQSVGVELDPGVPPPHEDILFVHVSAPVVDRHPVTVCEP